MHGPTAVQVAHLVEVVEAEFVVEVVEVEIVEVSNQVIQITSKACDASTR